MWNGPDGPLRTVSLITTAPNGLMRDIHDRMPVIVPLEDYGAWLDPSNQDVTKLKAFIRSYPAAGMEAYLVSKAVSYAKNEGADLIETVTPDRAQPSAPGSRS